MIRSILRSRSRWLTSSIIISKPLMIIRMNPPYQYLRKTPQWLQSNSHTFSSESDSFSTTNRIFVMNQEIRAILSVYGVKLISYNIDSLRACEVFENHSKKQFAQKISFLKDRLSLSSEELKSLLARQPRRLNLSIEELEERIKLFEGCSSSLLKELFISDKAEKIRIQSQSNEQLKRMLEIYRDEWGIKEENLPKAILDDYYWRKYKKHLGEDTNDINENQVAVIRDFFVNNYEIKFKKEIIYKLIEKEPFNRKDAQEKIDYLLSELQLSNKEFKTIVASAPEALHDSLQNLKKKMEYLKDKLRCSFDELKFFFLHRPIILNQRMKLIDYQDTILSKGYELSLEGMKKLLLNKNFSPIHLPAMVEDLEEKKMILNFLFPSQNSFNGCIAEFPDLLTISPERLCDVVDAMLEEGAFSSIEDPNIQRTFSTGPILLRSQKEDVSERIRNGMVVFNIVNIQKQQPSTKSRDYFAKRFSHHHQRSFSDKYEITSEKLKSLIIHSRKYRDFSTRAAKREEKAISVRTNNSQFITFFQSARTRSATITKQQQLSEICEMTRHNTANDPYQEWLLKTLRRDGDEIDLLKGIGWGEDRRKKIEEALRKGEKGRYEEGMDMMLAMRISRGKEIEKMNLSEEQLRKILLGSNVLSFVSSINLVEKLLLVTVMLHLNAEELIGIIDRFPMIVNLRPKANILRKLEILVKAAEEDLKERGELADLHEIPESMTLEEGKEYYRDHPVIARVRKTILQSPGVLTYQEVRWENAIAIWKEQPPETREWTKIAPWIIRDK